MESRNAEFYSLKSGDKIITTNGTEYEFIRYGRKNFICKKNGSLYRVNNGSFREVIERSPIIMTKDWSQELKEGDYFYMVKRSQCLVFKFKKLTTDRIIANNIVNNLEVSILRGVDGGKLPINEEVK